MATAGVDAHPPRSEGNPTATTTTTCCVVGAGPAGAVLALLLARQGVDVVLLEADRAWQREFRGNTINPAVMEIMAELGLAEQLAALPHTKIERFEVQTGRGPVTFADFGALKTRYPYIMMLPQASFLELVVGEAQRYPNFRLVMGARVEELIRRDGAVCGVRYRVDDAHYTLRATLTVGADGRFSRLRRLARLQPRSTATPMDVLWFNLPRKASDPETAGALFRFGAYCLGVLMDHGDHWQIGYIITKGSFPRLRRAGLPAFRRQLSAVLPELADRFDQLQDWHQTSLLTVEASCLDRWYQPGMLLIGDAAHTMSPVGGVGINHAILDAVVAANVVAQPLRSGRLTPDDLAAVQRQRYRSTRLVQLFQSCLHRWGVDGALRSAQPFRLHRGLQLSLRLPLVGALPAWLIAYGAWPVHVRPEHRACARTPDGA